MFAICKSGRVFGDILVPGQLEIGDHDVRNMVVSEMYVGSMQLLVAIAFRLWCGNIMAMTKNKVTFLNLL